MGSLLTIDGVFPKNVCDCGKELLPGAKKCANCGQYKSRWRNFIAIPSITALVMVIVALGQLLISYSKKIEARDVLQRANKTLEQVQGVKSKADKIFSDVQQTETDLNERLAKLSQNLEKFSYNLELTKNNQEELAEKQSNAEQKINSVISSINEQVSSSKDHLAELEDELKLFDQKIKFQQTLNAARNDDKKSYDQIKNWSEDDTYQLREDAKKQYRILQKDASFIFRNAEIYKSSKELLEKFLKINKNYSSEELVRFYKNIDPTQPYMKPYFIIYFAQYRTDIPIKKKLEFLIEIIRTDESLSAAKTAEDIFWQLVGQRHEEWYDEDLTLKYWNKNKNKY